MRKPILTYHIRMPEPHTHYFEVEILLENIEDITTSFKMASWSPGSYLIREYAKNIEQVNALDAAGNKLTIARLSKNNWQVQNNGCNFSFYYKVYSFEETVRTPFLNAAHASVIPTAVLMYPELYDVPSTIHFYPAPGWKNISTQLPVFSNNPWVRIAPNRDYLFDSPVEIGNHTIEYFMAAGIQHELAIYGAGNYDTLSLISNSIRIIEEEVKVFGHHPCKQYLFIIQNTANARGGLEHLDSTSLIARRFGYAPENNYVDFLSLLSHEYFHLWNVKRLRPAALGPFNYDAENYTTSLWIAEGFTNYYDDLILRRANIISTNDYLRIAEKNINEVENTPGNAVHPVAEASYEAWIKYYRQNENSINAQVNYYTKGGVLAMLLDLLIINNSDAKYCLDDVMKEAYQIFYLEQNSGYTEEEFRTILEKYAGISLIQFYSDHVFGVKGLDYNEFLLPAGLFMTNLNANTADADLGCTINEQNSITQIRKNSAAEKGKLNVQDEIIALNGFRFNGTLLPIILKDKKPGNVVRATINRGGILMELELPVGKGIKVNFTLALIEQPDARQELIYKKWLRTETFE